MSAGDYINDRARQERENAAANVEGSWLSAMAANFASQSTSGWYSGSNWAF